MTRKRLSNDRCGITKRVEACRTKFYTTVNFYDDGRPSEIFVTIAKKGSTVSGFARTLAVILSVALQSGTPWETLYEKLHKQKFEPRDDRYTSLVDAIAESVNESIDIMKGADNAKGGIRDSGNEKGREKEALGAVQTKG